VTDGLKKGLISGQVVQVAYIVTQKGLPCPGQTDCVVELWTDRQDLPLPRVHRQAYRKRRVTARTPQETELAGYCPGHRIIRPNVDVSVVKEKNICKRTKPFPGILVGMSNRLVADVAAGHDKRWIGAFKKEMVQGSVGQHNAERGAARGHCMSETVAGPLVQQHNRPFRRCQRGPFGVIEHAQRLHLLDAGRHNGKRFRIPVLTRSQRLDRWTVCRIARKMEAPEPFHRKNLPCLETGNGFANGVLAVHGFPLGVGKPDAGAADRATRRLGMETSVAGVFVLRAAFVAHGKRRHRRFRAVVRNVLDNGVPGTAVGAVDKGIPVTAVLRIAQLAQAVVARGQVRRHQHGSSALLAALPDRKIPGA